MKILAVNPEITTTRIGLYENEALIIEKNIEHRSTDLEKLSGISDQYPLRKQGILDFLSEQDCEPASLGCVVARGGLLRPVPGGTYKVCKKMIDDLSSMKFGEHVSNIGAVLAYGFQWDYKIPSFIVDPPVVDEMDDIARLSGLKEIPRRSAWQALNIMAVARQVCQMEKWNFKSENFVVAHLGDDCAVAAIEKGRCIDVSNCRETGPYTTERTGSLPSLELVNLCFSGKYSHDEMKNLIVCKGGLVSYLGTGNLREVEHRIEQGDDYAKMVLEGMAYQIAKEIGAYLVVLKGGVRRILLTGNAANSKLLTDRVKEWIEPLKPVLVIPGEDDLASLANGALRVLRREEKALDY